MGSQPDSLPAVDAILSGPYWPGRVRVIRAAIRDAFGLESQEPPGHKGREGKKA